MGKKFNADHQRNEPPAFRTGHRRSCLCAVRSIGDSPRQSAATFGSILASWPRLAWVLRST